MCGIPEKTKKRQQQKKLLVAAVTMKLCQLKNYLSPDFGGACWGFGGVASGGGGGKAGGKGGEVKKRPLSKRVCDC